MSAWSLSVSVLHHSPIHRAFGMIPHHPEREAHHGGRGGIRTHEAFRPAGFQDRCIRPLCHPSDGSAVYTIRIRLRTQSLPAHPFQHTFKRGLICVPCLFPPVLNGSSGDSPSRRRSGIPEYVRIRDLEGGAMRRRDGEVIPGLRMNVRARVASAGGGQAAPPENLLAGCGGRSQSRRKADIGRAA